MSGLCGDAERSADEPPADVHRPCAPHGSGQLDLKTSSCLGYRFDEAKPLLRRRRSCPPGPTVAGLRQGPGRVRSCAALMPLRALGCNHLVSPFVDAVIWENDPIRHQLLLRSAGLATLDVDQPRRPCPFPQLRAGHLATKTTRPVPSAACGRFPHLAVLLDRERYRQDAARTLDRELQ